ncbi:MAG: hypothetical protein IKJ05_09385 [Oscillospiraceae bacterium]|nr:hypothetical protein [Oscillospiraceae bacterium]
MESYKVIIWGLGHVGTAGVRQIVQRDSLQLVKAEPGFTNALDLPVGYRTK